MNNLTIQLHLTSLLKINAIEATNYINQKIVVTNDVEKLKNLLEQKKIIDKISF